MSLFVFESRLVAEKGFSCCRLAECSCSLVSSAQKSFYANRVKADLHSAALLFYSSDGEIPISKSCLSEKW